MDIENLLDELLLREGGFVDHPADRGGATNWGITVAVARDTGFMGHMRDLPKSLAKEIYRKRYWLNPRFDRVSQLSAAVAAELFDTGVNMGPAVAVGFLQRSLNALNRNGRDWPDMAADRRIGPVTLAAIEALMRVRGSAGERVLVKTMNALQGTRYIELAEKRPANEAFAFGWLDKRVGI